MSKAQDTPAAESNNSYRQFCEHCGASLDRREISWRLKFLALMMGEYSQMDFSLGEEECAGLMFILMDIAGMVSPESEKAGAA